MILEIGLEDGTCTEKNIPECTGEGVMVRHLHELNKRMGFKIIGWKPSGAETEGFYPVKYEDYVYSYELIPPVEGPSGTIDLSELPPNTKIIRKRTRLIKYAVSYGYREFVEEP